MRRKVKVRFANGTEGELDLKMAEQLVRRGLAKYVGKPEERAVREPPETR